MAEHEPPVIGVVTKLYPRQSSPTPGRSAPPQRCDIMLVVEQERGRGTRKVGKMKYVEVLERTWRVGQRVRFTWENDDRG